MKVLGITGGIACGKSTVTQLFAQWGAGTASADEDARIVILPGSATLDTVFAAFPETRTAQGTLDRARLADRIFGDPKDRLALEAIMHPAIFARMQQTIAAARETDAVPLFVYEVPLLFEKNREAMFDATLAVICSAQTQEARLQERERNAGRVPLSANQIAERLSAQLSNAEKANRADFTVRTDGTWADSEMQVRTIWQTMTGSFPQKGKAPEALRHKTTYNGC